MKRNVLFVTTLSVALLLGCKSKEEDSVSSKDVKKKSATTESKKKDGLVDTYKNDKLYQRSMYKDGLKNGVCSTFNADGSITVIDYKNNKAHGSSKRINKNGDLEQEYTYENGVKSGPYRVLSYTEGVLNKKGTYKDNKEHGVTTRYVDDNTIYSTTTYIKGKKDGEEKMYCTGNAYELNQGYKKGDLMSTNFYENGKRVKKK